MKNLLLIIAILTFGIAHAQDKKELDKNAIKSMCGCYEVKFNFAETFNYSESEDYKPSPVKHSGGLEWVELLEDAEDKIVMQHLLIVGNPAQPQIVKHWRQDWEFENTSFYLFEADAVWQPVTISADQTKGQWTQRVFQVDDSPRYEGSATWVHVDGKSYWENTTDAPLARREHTIRDDYNVLVRRNRHEITQSGWNHEQDNDKVIRSKDSEDVLLAQEKGLNTYTKVEDSKCLAAQEWWIKNKQYWADVRLIWDEVFATRRTIALNIHTDGEKLYNRLFALGDSVSESDKKYKQKKVQADIRGLIQMHMISDIKVAKN
ncbi:MAG: hypothetical protein RIF46_03065 [Cyclobacteriaceae bacterium]